MPDIKKKVAWRVGEDFEGHAVIVFHHHSLAARREGANELNTEFEYVECRRAKEFDMYADKGWVPPLALIKNGWWYECSYCGAQISEDEYDYDREVEMPLSEVVEVGDQVYCNQACRDGRVAEIASRNKKFEEFKTKVKQMRPDLDFFSFDGGWPRITMTAAFRFPGANYGEGTVRDDHGEITFWVASGDKEAWDKYESQRKESENA